MLIDFSQYYWQESFDGDSFVSQSRFDAYASHYQCFKSILGLQKESPINKACSGGYTVFKAKYKSWKDYLCL